MGLFTIFNRSKEKTMSLAAVVLALTSANAQIHVATPALDACQNAWDCPGSGQYCYPQDNWRCFGQGTCCAQSNGVGSICQQDGDCYHAHYCSKGWGQVNGSCQPGAGPAPTPHPVPSPQYCQYDRECGPASSGAYCWRPNNNLWGTCHKPYVTPVFRRKESDDIARRLPEVERLGATNNHVMTPARDECQTAWDCRSGVNVYCFPQDDSHCHGQGTCCAWSQYGEGSLCNNSDDCYGYELPYGNPDKQHCVNRRCRSLLFSGGRRLEEETTEDLVEELEVEEIEL